MDSYIEYMVKRAKKPLDYLLVFGVLLAGLAIVYLSTFLLLVPTIMLLLVVGAIYFVYKMLGRINTEYEYLIVNYEMDVDKIIGGKTRKRIDSVNLRRIENFGLLESSEGQKYLKNSSYKKVDACADKKNGGAFVTYSKNSVNYMLLFTPNEEMIEYIKKVNPGKF